MLGLTRWNPVSELVSLHRDLDALFSRVFDEMVRPQSVDSSFTFTPDAEVKREGDKWTISLALPGVDPKDVTIDVTGRTLRVSGERKSERREGTVAPLVSEISYGRFEREFTLPDEIDSGKVTAAYRDGMLELTLPLNERAKPRRVEIDTTPQAKQLEAA